MRFSMMVADGNLMLDACMSFIIADLECIEKIHGMGCSYGFIKEASHICLNHVSNLYVCGLIDEELFRAILDGIIVDDTIEGVIAEANDIRKDIVRQEDTPCKL